MDKEGKPMAGEILPQDASNWQNWEEECYQEGCAFARQRAQQKLQELDDKLFQNHPPGWKVVGFRERTITTRFGEITVSRRLYRDEQGHYHFLLDEHLGWQKRQLATPPVQEAVVSLAATAASYHEAAKILEKLTAGVLSVMTIHRLVQKTAAKAIAEEEKAIRACFREGVVPESGGRVVPRLYIEADGLWVRLQREEQSHYEIKTAIAYEGWERLPQGGERYRLVNKRVYCHAVERVDFWEGAALAFDRVWDTSRIELVVINGDGASWIDEGILAFDKAIRQIDGFHLARACRRALGESKGAMLYEAIRGGEWDKAEGIIRGSVPPKGKSKAQAWEWVKKLVWAREGEDWRNRVEGLSGGERGLGAMEGNEAQVLARRMKGKGMSWSIRGAKNMAKVRELIINGEVGLWCKRGFVVEEIKKGRGDRRKSLKKGGTDGTWLEARVPVLYGPCACEPWVRALRTLIHPPHLLN